MSNNLNPDINQEKALDLLNTVKQQLQDCSEHNLSPEDLKLLEMTDKDIANALIDKINLDDLQDNDNNIE